MEKTLNRLIKITEGCREDMHEPDEQGLRATVYGTELDNAMGDQPPTADAIINNCQEYGVYLERYTKDGFFEKGFFNLATLIALARKAVLMINGDPVCPSCGQYMANLTQPHICQGSGFKYFSDNQDKYIITDDVSAPLTTKSSFKIPEKTGNEYYDRKQEHLTKIKNAAIEWYNLGRADRQYAIQLLLEEGEFYVDDHFEIVRKGQF